MREYELNFIVQPEISEEGAASILEKLDGVLERSQAVRLMCEDLGKRKLAYEIRKFQKGHYYILNFLHDGAIVPELERTLRLEESVLRFLTVKAADEVQDVETRVADGQAREEEQRKRAAEKAQREAEEAKARAAAEATRAVEAAAEREAAEAAAAAAAEAPEEGEAAADPAAGADSADSAAAPTTEADPEPAAGADTPSEGAEEEEKS